MGLLENKIILITGATSGIGAASAEAFAAEGAKVALSGRRSAEGEALANRICVAGGDAIFLQADLSDEAQITAMVSRCVQHFGKLDGAFNNAGTGAGGPMQDMRPTDWDRVFDTNARAAYFCLQAEAEQMKRQGGPGAIVFNASVLARIAFPGTSIYSASKGAITSLTRAAAVELGPLGIRVNSISPALTRTPLGSQMISTGEGGSETSPLAPRGSIPLGRLGEPEDMAQAAMFLLSERASFVTGHDLVIDGGQSVS